MARTTLDIDSSILQQVRLRTELTGKSMGAVVSELLAVGLAASAAGQAAPVLRWTTADLGLPRVDLEDRDAVERLLDGAG